MSTLYCVWGETLKGMFSQLLSPKPVRNISQVKCKHFLSTKARTYVHMSRAATAYMQSTHLRTNLTRGVRKWKLSLYTIRRAGPVMHSDEWISASTTSSHFAIVQWLSHDGDELLVQSFKPCSTSHSKDSISSQPADSKFSQRPRQGVCAYQFQNSYICIFGVDRTTCVVT